MVAGANANSSLSGAYASVINAVSYGADPTGAADSSTAINNAITAAGASKSTRTVFLPPGTYLCNSTINIGNGSNTADSTYSGVVLLGAGPPGSPWCPIGSVAQITTLVAGTSLAGSLVQISGPIQGWGLQNLILDNTTHNVTGLTGLNVVAGQHGTIEHLVVRGFKICVNETTSTPVGSEIPNSTANRWRDITIAQSAETNSEGIVFDTTNTTANTCFEDWEQVFIVPVSTNGVASYGIVFRGCDSNWVKDVLFYPETFGDTFKGVVFDFGGVAGSKGWPGGNLVEKIDFGNNNTANMVGVVNGAGNTVVPQVVKAISYGNGNSPPTNIQGVKLQSDLQPGANWGLWAPATPASGVWQRFDWSVPVSVCVVAGAASLNVNLTPDGGTHSWGNVPIPAGASATFHLPAGWEIQWTGTTAPASWFGTYAGR